MLQRLFDQNYQRLLKLFKIVPGTPVVKRLYSFAEVILRFTTTVEAEDEDDNKLTTTTTNMMIMPMATMIRW